MGSSKLPLGAKVALGIAGLVASCWLSCFGPMWLRRRNEQHAAPPRVERPVVVAGGCITHEPAFGPGDLLYVACTRRGDGGSGGVLLRLHARDASEAAPPIALPDPDAMAVSRDGRRLVAITGRTARVLDPREAMPAITAVSLPISPYLVTVSPDGRAAYLADDWRAGGPVLRLDLDDASVRALIPPAGRGFGTCAMSLSPDGRTLALGRPGPRVALHTTDDGRMTASWGAESRPYADCPAVAFDPRGERVAELVPEKSSAIRRARDGEVIARREYRWSLASRGGYAVASWAPESLVGAVYGRIAATIDPETAEARETLVSLDDPTRAMSAVYRMYAGSLGNIYRIAHSRDGALLAVAPVGGPVQVIRLR